MLVRILFIVLFIILCSTINQNLHTCILLILFLSYCVVKVRDIDLHTLILFLSYCVVKVRDIAEMNFRYVSKSEPSSYATNLANNMQVGALLSLYPFE